MLYNDYAGEDKFVSFAYTDAPPGEAAAPVGGISWKILKKETKTFKIFKDLIPYAYLTEF